MSRDTSLVIAAEDRDAQVVPWVQVHRADGTETTYVSTTTRLTPEQIARLPKRAMDCADCHNRVGHDLPTPVAAVDQALFEAESDAIVLPPTIKRTLVKTLTATYRTADEAHLAIRAKVTAAFQATTPAGANPLETDSERLIEFAMRLYDRGVFPEQGIDWGTYGNHLGHRFSSGCFRCHDGQHVAADGKILTQDCGTSCHTAPILAPPSAVGVPVMNASGEWHPWQLPIRDLGIPGHDRLLCADCHGAGRLPKRACDDCHHPPGI